MKQLTAPQVRAQKVAELGLDPAKHDLLGTEALAAALRRAAGFLCPCGPATLVRAVVGPLRGLVDDEGAVKERAQQTLDAMVAHGDLLEHADVEGGSAMLLYTAPPAFVLRESGSALLLGVAADQPSALPNDLETRVEHRRHVRRLVPENGEDLRERLAEFGLIELLPRVWLRAPTPGRPEALIASYDRLLDTAQPSRDVPGLAILDPTRPVRYYRGRWTEPGGGHSGRFVGRRRQNYGADRWCYVELREGAPERLVDLPVRGSRWRGCDEAWWLQLALDARRGEPQRYRLSDDTDGNAVLELFSPAPTWAQRRWDSVGDPVAHSGCLFAYRLPPAEVEEELRFAKEELWLEELNA